LLTNFIYKHKIALVYHTNVWLWHVLLHISLETPSLFFIKEYSFIFHIL